MSESTRTSVPLILVAPGSSVGARRGEPVTLGVPLPRGAQQSPESWWVRGQDGRETPAQFRVLDRWGDGSIRWVLVDFHADVRELPGAAELRFDRKTGQASGGEPSIACSQVGADLLIRTGPNAFRCAPGRDGPFEAVGPGDAAGEGTRVEVRLSDVNGGPVPVKWRRASLEEEGPVRSSVRMDGTGRTSDGATLDLTLRCHFYAGSSVVRLLLTVRNSRRAAHPGGYWELGDPGSVLLRDVSLLVLPGSSAMSVRCSAERNAPFSNARRRVHLYQDSSGGDNWQSRNHVNRNGVVPNAFRGYRLELEGAQSSGLRATPVVVLDGGGEVPDVGVAVPEFWENFPRAVEADLSQLRIGFWPREYADLHELQGGEQKTHECYLGFGPDSVTDVSMDWCRSRLLAHASPEWYAATGAVPYVTPADRDPHGAYLALVNTALDGGHSFVQKREQIDEYGWRHFGDLYGDHEAVNAPDQRAFCSHYNNQYDATAGFALHFLRSGDPRWWRQMDELARHVVDIDIYHTDHDKSAYSHGLFWHTAHYVDAGRSTHRTYPRVPGSGGGGPSNEHDYTTGLMLHHFLTGSAQSRDAVLELARWVIDMDDGRKTVFRWLDRGPTGLASATGSRFYHGPGRGAANSIVTLLNAHSLTGQACYLEKAEQLLARCISPDDDVPARNLLDAERRWYYTVFLQAVGRYLCFKAERGQIDAAYGYGRAALLSYARWMVAHEYPYLDKPEILEYPNETWAAQDMRKSEVFMLASPYADGEDQRRFEERAAFFFDYATTTLGSMPSHVLTRPTVLMLVNGYMRNWHLAHPACRPPVGCTPSLPSRRSPAFVPQRARAERRAVALSVVCTVAILILLVVLWQW